MSQGGELGELVGGCEPGAVLDCALGWAAGEVLGCGVADALELGEPPGPDGPGLPGWPACWCPSRPGPGWLAPRGWPRCQPGTVALG